MCVTLPSLSHFPSHLTNSRTPCLLRRFAARHRWCGVLCTGSKSWRVPEQLLCFYQE